MCKARMDMIFAETWKYSINVIKYEGRVDLFDTLSHIEFGCDRKERRSIRWRLYPSIAQSRIDQNITQGQLALYIRSQRCDFGSVLPIPSESGRKDVMLLQCHIEDASLVGYVDRIGLVGKQKEASHFLRNTWVFSSNWRLERSEAGNKYGYGYGYGCGCERLGKVR